MTNPPPLNPDALEAAADIIWMNTRGESGICEADRRTDDFAVLEAVTSVAIKEYLAVAHPEVTTRHGVKQLPLGTMVLDEDNDLMQYLPDGEGGAYWLRLGDTMYYGPSDISLPAQVLKLGEL